MIVGIMSMQRILNYGSFMQALALKTIIESLGHEVKFIDYHPGIFVGDRKVLSKRIKHNKEHIKYLVKSSAFVMSLKRRCKKNSIGIHKAFLDCYGMLGFDDVYSFKSDVDILVIGSDEVFNCLQTNPNVGYAPELFGKHSKANKLISYAASFGSTTLKGLENYGVKKEISVLLKEFDKISVRDKNSAALIKTLCGYEPEQHLDPVLVGDIENREWKRIDREKYLVVYGYGNRFTEEEGQAIQRFAKDKGLQMIAIAGKQDFCDEYVQCRPDEVITYIKDAAYVITDTFHGSIFSAICHKQFVTFCRRKDNVKEGQASNEEKLIDMFNKVGLADRLIDSPDEIEKVIDKSIDYERVDDIRRKECARTISYLKANLN